MRPMLFAFHYFTNLPLPGEPGWDERVASASLTWLPFTGLAVGFCLCALELIFRNTGAPQYPPLKALLVMTMELWTGGSFILGGFCKSCEGMLSQLGRTRSLEIMKESRLGATGAIGLVFALLAKLLLLAEMSLQKDYLYILLFYPCWGRWALSFAACNYPAAKNEGMAYFFKSGQKPAYILLSSAFVLMLLILTPGSFYLAALLSFAALLFCCSQEQARLGGQTEDTYGLAAVVAELTFLLFLALSAPLFAYLGG